MDENRNNRRARRIKIDMQQSGFVDELKSITFDLYITVV